MTEHFKNGSEIGFVDRTIIKLGSEKPEGLNCKWELHALPEYIDSDIELSKSVIEETFLFLKENNINNVTIDLAEGYDDEDNGSEHYRLQMVFGDGNDNQQISLFKKYSADTGDSQIKGSVRLKIGLSSDSIEEHKKIEEKVTSIYIKIMEETYPEWKNKWEDSQMSLLK